MALCRLCIMKIGVNIGCPTVGLETGCVGTGPPRKNLMTSHQPTGDCEDQYSLAGLGWAGLACLPFHAI